MKKNRFGTETSNRFGGVVDGDDFVCCMLAAFLGPMGVVGRTNGELHSQVERVPVQL